jgi:hypothetical protein
MNSNASVMPVPKTPEFHMLVAGYPQLATERERAATEARLVAIGQDCIKAIEHTRHYNRERWLRGVLGNGSTLYELKTRAALQVANLDALWEQVDRHDMALGTAIRLLKLTRSKARLSGRLLGDCLGEVLKSYDLASTTVTSKHRRSFRRRTIADRMRTAKSEDVGSSKNNRERLRQAVLALVKEQACDLSEVAQIDLYNRLYADVSAAITAFLVRMKDLLAVSPAEITRRNVTEACKVLQMKPPKPGRPADLSLARRQRRQLMHMLHPDKNQQGNVDDIMKVHNAFYVLEKYNQQLTKEEEESQ